MATHDRTVRGGRRVRQLFFPATVGDLEGVLFCRVQETPNAVAVFCHPHPQYGGSMHNKVAYRSAETLFDEGWPTLRFNFRGVGKSAGTWGGGAGEMGDAKAAIDFAGTLYPGLPVLLGGFSFGAGVALTVGAGDERVAALLGVAPSPTRRDLSFLSKVAKPKGVVQGTEDELCPVEDLRRAYASWAEPKSLHLVPGASHFFEGRIAELKEAVRSAVRAEAVQEALAARGPAR